MQRSTEQRYEESVLVKRRRRLGIQPGQRVTHLVSNVTDFMISNNIHYGMFNKRLYDFRRIQLEKVGVIPRSSRRSAFFMARLSHKNWDKVFKFIKDRRVPPPRPKRARTEKKSRKTRRGRVKSKIDLKKEAFKESRKEAKRLSSIMDTEIDQKMVDYLARRQSKLDAAREVEKREAASFIRNKVAGLILKYEGLTKELDSLGVVIRPPAVAPGMMNNHSTLAIVVGLVSGYTHYIRTCRARGKHKCLTYMEAVETALRGDAPLLASDSPEGHQELLPIPGGGLDEAKAYFKSYFPGFNREV